MNSEMLENTLVTCFEGGSNHWVFSAIHIDLRDLTRPATTPWYADRATLDHPDFAFTLTDDEGDSHRLDRDSFNKGWDKFSQLYPVRAKRIAEDDGSADAEDYDVLLQVTVYGEVVFG